MKCICFHLVPGSTSDELSRFPGEKPETRFYLRFIAFVFAENLIILIPKMVLVILVIQTIMITLVKIMDK